MSRIVKIIFGFYLAVAFLLVAKIFLWDVPSLRFFNPGTTAFMRRHDGAVTSSWVPLSQMPSAIARCLVASEDAKFYSHDGIDWDALKQSWQKNLKEGQFARGGSTITMQLAKNLYLSPAKNVVRKGFEILIALEMDALLSKERILEIYLNVIEWGGDAYGIEAAARRYFHKPATNLTLEEAAFLTAIIPNPQEWGIWPPGPYVRRRMGTIRARMASAPAPDMKNLSGQNAAAPTQQPAPKKSASLSPVTKPQPSPTTQKPDNIETAGKTTATEPESPSDFFIDDY